MVLASHDPADTDGDLYKVIFENDRVRVLEYHDQPGDRTHPHRHPDSIMFTLSSFRRRTADGDRSVDVDIPAGTVRWVGAQQHSGQNIGDTRTHCIFMELKEPPASISDTALGPQI
jgi:hypothetical protein